MWMDEIYRILTQGLKQVNGQKVAQRAADIDPVFAAKLAKRRAKERREVRGQI